VIKSLFLNSLLFLNSNFTHNYRQTLISDWNCRSSAVFAAAMNNTLWRISHTKKMYFSTFRRPFVTKAFETLLANGLMTLVRPKLFKTDISIPILRFNCLRLRVFHDANKIWIEEVVQTNARSWRAGLNYSFLNSFSYWTASLQQNGKVEYERDSCSYSTFPLCSGDNLNQWNSYI
jgi:hypothetical protein